MQDSPPWVDSDTAIRRFVVGWAVLIVTVVLSNSFGLLEHPDRIFDVLPNSPLMSRIHTAGFIGQLLSGSWLALSLMLEIPRGRRACFYAWLASLAAFVAPMPAARQDAWLLPMLLVIAGLVGVLSRAVDAALGRNAS